jgi:HlyD family secretion protein
MSVSVDERLGPEGSWLTPRRAVWAFVAVGVLIAILLAVRVSQSFAAKRAITNKGDIPSVTVTEAGVSALPTTVAIIGTINARFDTPIGVDGDGGRVSAVLAEAGDHVKRGQVLARIDTSVLEPQVANLQASLELARAESELAAAEYHRAQAVGAAGALSAEETEKRRSTSVTAAAKVKVDKPSRPAPRCSAWQRGTKWNCVVRSPSRICRCSRSVRT